MHTGTTHRGPTSRLIGFLKLNWLTHAKQHYVMQVHWLTTSQPFSEATRRHASENDSSSDTEDLFVSMDEDEGELEENEIVLEDDC